MGWASAGPSTSNPSLLNRGSSRGYGGRLSNSLLRVSVSTWTTSRDSSTARSLTDDIDVAFGTIPAGTVGAVRMVASGIVDQHEAIVVEHVIRMARDVAPDWPASDSDATYLVSIEGEPDIDVRLSLGEAEGHGAGNSAMTATAMRVVNAVPYVVEAAPGLLSSLDVPLTVPRHAL